MLHSKVFYLDMGDGSACAFIGSHNITGFALHGLNGEAGVLVEGPTNDREIQAVRRHIDECVAQSVPYTPGMKEAYAWWAAEFIEGFRDKFDDRPRVGEANPTILILAVHPTDPLPKKGDVIYFELPTALGTVNSLRAQVHIYIFTTRPASPREALAKLGQARESRWCQTKGLEVERGGVELRADWYIESARNPELKRAPQPFRPRAASGIQQVRVKVWNSVFDRYEYLFTGYRQTWEPVFDFDHPVQASVHAQEELYPLKLMPRED